MRRGCIFISLRIFLRKIYRSRWCCWYFGRLQDMSVEYTKITQITNSETWCQIIAVILTADNIFPVEVLPFWDEVSTVCSVHLPVHRSWLFLMATGQNIKNLIYKTPVLCSVFCRLTWQGENPVRGMRRYLQTISIYWLHHYWLSEIYFALQTCRGAGFFLWWCSPVFVSVHAFYNTLRDWIPARI